MSTPGRDRKCQSSFSRLRGAPVPSELQVQCRTFSTSRHTCAWLYIPLKVVGDSDLNPVAGADRQWAAQYEPGDIVRYTRGSNAVGVQSSEYVRVTGVDREQNLLTVERHNGEHLTYDPRRLNGVSVYREAQRDFSSGDRVQFTAPYRDEHIANRQLGTVQRVDSQGNLQVRLDSGQQVQFNIRDYPHVDYGYALTSHSSQGVTADRLSVHSTPQLLDSSTCYRHRAGPCGAYQFPACLCRCLARAFRRADLHQRRGKIGPRIEA